MSNLHLNFDYPPPMENRVRVLSTLHFDRQAPMKNRAPVLSPR